MYTSKKCSAAVDTDAGLNNLYEHQKLTYKETIEK